MQVKYVERNYFHSNKNKKDYFTIRIYIEDIKRSILIFVDDNVYDNYNNSKFGDNIPDNKVKKSETVNQFGQVVVSYKLIN